LQSAVGEITGAGKETGRTVGDDEGLGGGYSEEELEGIKTQIATLVSAIIVQSEATCACS